MAAELLMFSPLSEEKALTCLLAGDTGPKHQVCSPLQRKKCEFVGHCMSPAYDAGKGELSLALADFKICTPVTYSCHRMAEVPGKKG